MATFRAQISNAGPTRIITPAVGDLLVMFIVASGNTNDAPTCSDNNPAGDGSYHPAGVLRWNASGNRAAIFVRNHLIDNTTSTTVTVTVGAATTTFTALVAFSGMTLAGAAAVRQFGMQENQPAAGTAGATVGGACLTDNLTLTALFSNDFSQTPPTGWTERVENGVPPCINVCTRDSGYTGTGENYNATPSSVFAAAFIELDTSAGGGAGLDIDPTGIASTEMHGATNLARYIDASSIGSAEAHGATNIEPVTAPSAIASAEAHGASRLSHRIEASGIISAEAHGIIRVDSSIGPGSIISAEAHGDAHLSLAIAPSAIASVETHGAGQLTHRISAAAIASAEAYGNVILQDGGIQAGSIPSAEAFGTSRTERQVIAVGVASAEAHSTATTAHIVSAVPIASSEAHGVAVTAHALSAVAIASAEIHGNTNVDLSVIGIVSAETHGTSVLATLAYLLPVGVVAAEAFGIIGVRLPRASVGDPPAAYPSVVELAIDDLSVSLQVDVPQDIVEVALALDIEDLELAVDNEDVFLDVEDLSVSLQLIQG